MTEKTKRWLLILLVVAVGLAAVLGPTLYLRLRWDGLPPPVSPEETRAVTQ